MDERDRLPDRFETHRGHLRAVAYRMLGSVSEADDAVQETWVRFSTSDSSGVDNLGGWLTTIVGRVCLNMLRSRTSRREEPLTPQEADQTGPALRDPDAVDPEDEVLLADSVGRALLVVLDRLAPAERLAFVLHDTFAVPFEEIAPIVERSPAAARQLASRARRRVQQATATTDTQVDVSRQRAAVDAFLAASRSGDFDALLELLDPDIVLRADAVAVQFGASPAVRGANAVADNFPGRARAALPALVDGAAAAVWAPGGKLRVVVSFTFEGDKITAIDLLADPEHLERLDVTILRP